MFSLSASPQQWARQFDFVDDASCGLALVGKGNKRGFVDKDGRLLVPLVYDEAMHYSEGMAAVKKKMASGVLLTAPAKRQSILNMMKC